LRFPPCVKNTNKKLPIKYIIERANDIFTPFGYEISIFDFNDEKVI
jgi:hypothetical protein